MTTIDNIVRSFLEGYGRALSTGDLPAIVNSWDTPALVLSDQGARMVSQAAEVEQFFAGAVEWYRAQGLAATRPSSVEIKRLSERLVSVDARWSAIDITGARETNGFPDFPRTRGRVTMINSRVITGGTVFQLRSRTVRVCGRTAKICGHMLHQHKMGIPDPGWVPLRGPRV